MTTIEWIDKIAEGLRVDSEYPYPEGHTEADSNRHFAYGLCIGTLLALKTEWERKME